MVFQVTEFENAINFLFLWFRDVMTSCHDVTKLDSPISACRRARKFIHFCLHGFVGHWVQKDWWFFICMISWRHDVMSWRHKNWSTYLRLWIHWKDDRVQDSTVFLVAQSRNVSVHVFVGWYHVMTSRHDVTSILNITLQYLLIL